MYFCWVCVFALIGLNVRDKVRRVFLAVLAALLLAFWLTVLSVILVLNQFIVSSIVVDCNRLQQ